MIILFSDLHSHRREKFEKPHPRLSARTLSYCTLDLPLFPLISLLSLLFSVLPSLTLSSPDGEGAASVWLHVCVCVCVCVCV